MKREYMIAIEVKCLFYLYHTVVITTGRMLPMQGKLMVARPLHAADGMYIAAVPTTLSTQWKSAIHLH
jgi:hypothetical protein